MLSLAQAGKRLGVNKNTIKRWIVNFGLPCQITKGGTHRIAHSELDAWAATSRPAPKQRIVRNYDPRDDEGSGVIYVLTDPRPEYAKTPIRYVGKSYDFRRRKRDYRQMFANGEAHSVPLTNWFRKLKSMGLEPGIKVMEECLFGVGKAEREWIEKGRAKGWKLLNITDGGEAGKFWSEDAKRAASERTKAKWADPIYRANWVRSMGERGMLKTPEQRWLDELQKEVWRGWWERLQAKKAWAAIPCILTPLTHKGTAFIYLTNGKIALIDAEDWERVGKHIWHAGRKQETGEWRAMTNLGDGRALLTRFVVEAKPSEVVSPINYDALDCRRSNLLVGSRSKIRRDRKYIRLKMLEDSRVKRAMKSVALKRRHNVAIVQTVSC